MVALNSGMVGLSLFLGFFAAILIGLWQVAKYDAYQKLGLGNCARALAATSPLQDLVTIATVSSIDFIPYVYWSFAGLCVAFIRIAFRQRALVARGPYVRRSEGGVRFVREMGREVVRLSSLIVVYNDVVGPGLAVQIPLNWSG